MSEQVFEDPSRPTMMGDELTLQFAAPFPAMVPIGHYEPGGKMIVDEVVTRSDYLSRLQETCRQHGAALNLRFYAHYGDDEFDAAILDALDEVQSLTIDVYCAVTNPEAVGRLPKLARLSFSPRAKCPPDQLRKFGVERLEELTLGETASPTLDLSPIGEAQTLHTLRLLSRGKKTEAIGDCAKLKNLAIVPSDKFEVGFIGRLQQLEVLKFVLGKIESVAAVPSLSMLRDLSFKEVHSLEDLGDLQRFPALRRLQLEDQKRVEAIKVGTANKSLDHIRLYSVPSLVQIEGLKALPALCSLWAYDVALKPDWNRLPKTLTHFQLVSKRVRERPRHDAEVAARGLIADRHPEGQFFYK